MTDCSPGLNRWFLPSTLGLPPTGWSGGEFELRIQARRGAGGPGLNVGPLELPQGTLIFPVSLLKLSLHSSMENTGVSLGIPWFDLDVCITFPPARLRWA